MTPTPLEAGPRRSAQATQEVPSIGGTLTGLGSNIINPADAQVAVGPSDVIEMANSNVKIWSKTGTVENSESLGQYFTSSGVDRRLDEFGDPRVLYDRQSGRWFALALDITQHETVMVISPTAQPGSGTWVYDFPSSGCPDQPRLGVSDSLVAFGDNLFSDCSTYADPVGGEVTVLNKNDLLTGAAVDEDTYGPSTLDESITPVVSLSATPVLWFVSSDFHYGSIDLIATDKVRASGLDVRPVPVNPFAMAPDALQSDPLLINTGDNRIQNAVWENSQLWLAISEGCTVNGEDGIHACGRFIGINTSDPANPTVTLDAGVALDQNRDLFYPAIMPASDGTLYAVFGYSSASETPGIGVLADPDQLTNWAMVTQGSGANESGRWGDYFGIARDPSDPTHIWIGAAYGTGSNAWSSTVAAIGATPFSIKPQAPPPPTPASKVCLVPRLTGLRLASANAKLRKNNCRPGTASLRTSSRPKGIVLAQSKAAGNVLAAGTTVNLITSRGPKRHH